MNHTWLMVLLALMLLMSTLAGWADARGDELAAALNWKSSAVPVPLMAMAPCKTPPVIDGKYDAQKWVDANALCMLSHHGEAYAFPNAIVYITYDANHVYFGYLRDKAKPDWFPALSRFRDSPTYMDPHIELFLSPDPGTGKTRVYQFCINAYGAVYDILNVPEYGQTSPGYNPKIEFKTSETQSQFYLEGSIDVKELDPTGHFRDGATWRANFCWAWPQISWASRGGFWIVRDNMGTLRLDAAAPALQWLDAYPLMEGQLDIAAAVKNLTTVPKTYLLSATVTGGTDKDILAKAVQSLTLAPGERREVRLRGDGAFPGKRGHCTLTCSSADGAVLYYQQFLRLDGKNAGARAKRLEVMKQDLPMPKDIALTTRYGPLSNTLEVQADVWFLRRAGIALDHVHIWVEDKTHPGTSVVAKDIAQFQKDLAMDTFHLPANAPYGTYLVKAQALAKDGALISEAKPMEFTRLNLHDPAVNKPYRARDGRLMDWIGSTCGITNKVPPPWTPIQGNPGSGLQVLHRHITLERSGLPRQIIAAEEPLLAAPISFQAIAGGKSLPLTAANEVHGFTLDQAGLTAHWEGQVGGKAFSLSSKARLEYDGLMAYEVAIDCPTPVKLDALYLDIPLRKAIADQLNLPNSHLLLPEGKGLLWKSKDEVDNELMNTLVSHVWVGNWKCGLAFVVDDTKGWYEQIGQSLEIVTREADAVHLRVYLVQGPQLVSSTVLHFTLLPTPTRDRPQGWRGYPHMDGHNYSWIMDWFDDRQYEGTKAWPIWGWDDMTKEQLDKMKKDERSNNPTLGLPYTNPWFDYPWVVPWSMGNGSPTTPIVNEDWANMPTRWGMVRPVASYRDFMTFNYDFYFRTKHYGGFYIDEAYGAEKEDINMVNGSGWLDRSGHLRGSYHSMDVRELFKRQYVISMQNSPIGKPFMLNHTSWGLSPQYMSHVTCGVYVENLPIGVGEGYLDHMPLSALQFWSGRAWGQFSDVTGCGPDAKSHRYCVGQLTLHDVCASFDLRNKIKRDFDIAADDVRFFGYWEQPTVVTSSDNNIKASVFQRPNSLLLVVCNVDTQHEHQALLTLDAKTLGIPANCPVTDYETGKPVSWQHGKLAIRLAPRDVQYLHLTTL